jgi:hypothetical protein
MPFMLGMPRTISTCILSYPSASAGRQANAIIFAVNTDGGPGLPLAQTGSVNTSATGNTTATLSATLPAGNYYLGIIQTNNTTISAFSNPVAMIGWSTAANIWLTASVTFSGTIGDQSATSFALRQDQPPWAFIN